MAARSGADIGRGSESARERFARHLRELFVPAPKKPTLEQIVRATQDRLGPKRTVASIQRLSDWRTGKNVPDRFDVFEPHLSTLIFRARAQRAPVPPDLLNVATWRKLWQEARHEEAAEQETVAAYSGTPLPARPAVTDTLPRDVETLIGRDTELAHFLGMAGSRRPVSVYTIDGMPGVGKTALATRAAHELTDQFPDGRFFVNLHAHSSGRSAARPEDVLGGLLTDLGVDPRVLPPTLESRRALWRDRLADKRILLVLDDAHDHAQVEPLLPNHPNCLTIITSRKRMVALDGSQSFALATLEPDKAAELFRAVSRRGGTDDAAAVAEIVALCGYLPLAVVLVGGRLAHHPMWTVEQLAADLASAQDRLGEMEAGERAVQAAFTMSYQDLTPQSRQLFRRLALHPGPDIDRYAAAALGGVSVAEARTRLEGLFTDHLLDEPSAGRFRMHDLLREFGLVLSAADPAEERTEAVDRLLDFYQDLGNHADRQLTAAPNVSPVASGPALSSRSDAVHWLRRERANLTSCLEYAATTHRPARVVGLTGAVAGLLRLDGPWDQAVDLHRRAAATAERLGDGVGAADAFCDLSAVRYATGDYPATTEALRRALTLYQESGDRIGEAYALGNLARLGYATGDYPGTADLMRRALMIYRDGGDHAGEAYARTGLGVVRYATGDYSAATDLMSEALRSFQHIEDREGEAYARNELGVVRYAVGDYAGAADAVEAALTIYRDTGDRFSEAYALTDLAWVRFATGDYPGAERLLQAALAIHRETGDRLGEAYGLSSLGRLSYATGDTAGATDQIHRALAIFEELGDRLGRAYTHGDLSLIHYATADYVGAGTQLESALTTFTEIGDRMGEAYTLIGLGLARYAAAEHDRAEEVLLRALSIFGDIGDRVGRAYTLASLGRLSYAAGDCDTGIDRVTRSLDVFTDIGDRVGRAYALSSLGRLRFAAGDVTGAEDLTQQAISIYAEIGDRFGHAFALGGLSILRFSTDRIADAPALAEQALAIFTEIGDRVSQAYTFIGLGLLRYKAGDYPGALAMTEQAPAIFHEIGDRLGEVYAFIGLALVRYKTGDISATADLAQRVLAVFREIGERPGQAEMLDRIAAVWDEHSEPHNAVVSYIDALRLVREIHVRWKKRRVWRDLPVPDVHR
ncbi:tetratricopeptide repeat protein [Nocardia sp. BMG111209]|uniref:tetratricopeptide repeat protein n=1 Tax=Nocardia sp. BMG111209 TaxID=1160137 RepID=UPI00039BAA9A|nr:tetratricopeptide repeat protein [Nocardia sp. BMG111209]